jgi:hypothetical protein
MKPILCRVNFFRQSSYVFKKTKQTRSLDCVRDSKTVRMILTRFQFVLEALGPRIVCVVSVWKKVRKQQRKCAGIAMLWSQVLFYSPRAQDKVSDRLYEICSILIMYWVSLHPVLWNRYHAIRRYRILLLLLLPAIGFLPGGSVQYTSRKKHKHYVRRRRRRKTPNQTYNTITRNRKDKKQLYSTKNKHKTSNTNLQDNKITYWTMKQHT